MDNISKAHILIVDDDKSTCETLSDIFNLNDFQTTTAHNGKDGLALIKAQHIDIVLLDIGFQISKGWNY